MASRKSKRYGQGGMKHKKTPNATRPNGKAWKKHPKAFDRESGRLFTSLHHDKGTTV